MNHELITPNPKECTWGIRYLLFQLIFLGSLIVAAARVLGFSITAAQLNILYFTINFAAAILICRHFLLRSMTQGFRNLGQSLGLALGGFGIYEVATLLLGILIIRLQPDFSNVNDQNLSEISQSNYSLMTLCTVLLVPLTEEIFFRGVIFGGLYHRNRWAAYLVSILGFALVHVSGYIGAADPLTLLLCFVQYIPAGICLAIVYERSCSLLPSVLIHTAVNAIGMLAMR